MEGEQKTAGAELGGSAVIFSDTGMSPPYSPCPFVFRPTPAPAGQTGDPTCPKAMTIRHAEYPVYAPDMGFRQPALPRLPETAAEALSDAGTAYFRQMITRYWTFPNGDAPPAACLHFNLQALSIIYALITKSANERPTWGDLHQLEMALLEVTPETTLRGQAWLLRARYRESVPPARFRLYLRSRPETWDDQTVPVETLRADQEVLMAEIHRLQLSLPMRPEARSLVPSAARLAGLCRGGARRVGAFLAPLHLRKKSIQTNVFH